MAFQKPTSNQLTDQQSKALASLSSINGIFDFKPHVKLSPDKQISVFDYLKRVTKATIGPAAFENFLLLFLNKLFDSQSDKLERIIISSIAKKLDSENKHISNSQTNQVWLTQNVLPGLHTSFQVSKAIIVKQIVTMMFGPKTKMAPSNQPAKQDAMLQAAVCSSGMFSTAVSSSPDDNGDVEYNTVKLKERLTAGQMIFTVSCQDIKVSLPDNILNQADQIIQNNSASAKPPINPAIIFTQIQSFINTEVQRINSQENSNAVSKGFFEILIQQLLSLITVVIQPYMSGIMTTINNGPNGHLMTAYELNPSPCDIKTAATTQDPSFKQKSFFASALMNGIYAFLLSTILDYLIKELKKLIKKFIAKMAQDRAKREALKKSMAYNNALSGLDNAQKSAEAAQPIIDIAKF
jgi:hypothetical protein